MRRRAALSLTLRSGCPCSSGNVSAAAELPGFTRGRFFGLAARKTLARSRICILVALYRPHKQRREALDAQQSLLNACFCCGIAQLCARASCGSKPCLQPRAARAMRRLLLWLVAHAAAKTKYDVVDRDDATTFGILIDAGSTGSRVHIYQWEKRDFNTLPPPLSLPLTSERWTERIKPGLSDYNDDAERAARTSVPAWKSKYAPDTPVDLHPG